MINKPATTKTPEAPKTIHVTLNEGQLAAEQSIRQWLAQPIDDGKGIPNTSRYMSLTGGGGSGKTTMLFPLLIEMANRGQRILLTAPTNKACRVLRETSRKWGYEFEVMTLAKALGLALLPSEEDKRIRHVGQPVLVNYALVVLDEASMASKMAVDIVEGALAFSGTKLLSMGDDCQLPPVRESRPEAFDLGPKVELSKIERYSGAILEFASTLREHVKTKQKIKTLPSILNADGSGVHHALGKQFVPKAMELVDLDNPDKTRVLAWTNARVDAINQAIRQHFHGLKVPPFLVGDKVVTTDVVKDPEGNDILLPVDEDCEVTAVHEDFVDGAAGSGLTFPSWMLVLRPLHGGVRDVVAQVIKPEHKAEWESHLADVAKRAKINRNWTEYWYLRESVHQVKHCYAITIHRSQGSTFTNVFLDVIDIQKNQKIHEQLKLLYVGASRPTTNLFLNREKCL